MNVDVPVAPISLIAIIAKNKRSAGEKTEENHEMRLTSGFPRTLAGLIFNSEEVRRIIPHAIIGNDHTRYVHLQPVVAKKIVRLMRPIAEPRLPSAL